MADDKSHRWVIAEVFKSSKIGRVSVGVDIYSDMLRLRLAAEAGDWINGTAETRIRDWLYDLGGEVEREITKSKMKAEGMVGGKA